MPITSEDRFGIAAGAVGTFQGWTFESLAGLAGSGTAAGRLASSIGIGWGIGLAPLTIGVAFNEGGVQAALREGVAVGIGIGVGILTEETGLGPFLGYGAYLVALSVLPGSSNGPSTPSSTEWQTWTPWASTGSRPAAPCSSSPTGCRLFAAPNASSPSNGVAWSKTAATTI